MAAPGWYLKDATYLGCSWCRRRGPLCGLHLTPQASLCSWPGKRKESAEQASHQPQEVQPCPWGLTLCPQVLSEFLWVELGPTITDRNWKTLIGLTWVSAWLTNSKAYSSQRTTRRLQIRGYLVTVNTFVQALSILQFLLQSYHYVAVRKLPLLTSLEMELNLQPKESWLLISFTHDIRQSCFS